MRGFELYDAGTVKEAVDLLQKHGSRTVKVLGGGSDLVGGVMKDWVQGKGMPLPEVLIDLTTIKDLATIKLDGGSTTIGAVFTEELLVDKATGLPLNPNLLDYRPLSIKDAPLAEVVIVEKPKAYGTFGGHGLGEPPMGPPAPTIVNAVYNAVGVWVTEMPLTRDKLLAALKASN